MSRAGHSFVSFSPAVSRDALTRIRRTIRAWRIHRRSDMTFAEIVAHINTYVAGWIAYYGRFRKSALYAASVALTYILCGGPCGNTRDSSTHARKRGHG